MQEVTAQEFKDIMLQGGFRKFYEKHESMDLPILSYQERQQYEEVASYKIKGTKLVRTILRPI